MFAAFHEQVETLKLRLGAQVMLLQNEMLSEEDKARMPPEQKLVNGSRGVVVGWAPDPEDDDKDQRRGGGYQGEPGTPLRGATDEGAPSSSVEGTAGGEGEGGGEGKGEGAEAAGPPTLYPLVRFVNGRTKVIAPATFEKEIYLLGTCVRLQVPLALAWCAFSARRSRLPLCRTHRSPPAPPPELSA